MKLRLYLWDELGNEIECWDQTNPDAAREENMGWEYDKLLSNGVVVLCTDRHYALETWAKDKDEAHEKFMEFELYREYQDE